MKILLLILSASLIGLGLYRWSKSKTRRIELEVDFIPSVVDSTIKKFKVINKVNVAGIIGTEFLEKYKYVIDFNKNVIRHHFYTISFDGAMKILRIPYITLWQEDKKFIFIIDTGSTNCHISSEALESLEFDYADEREMITFGVGGHVGSNKMVKAKLYYR